MTNYTIIYSLLVYVKGHKGNVEGGVIKASIRSKQIELSNR